MPVRVKSCHECLQEFISANIWVPAALAGTASFTVMDTICAYKRHQGTDPAHRWIFEQNSFKLGPCHRFRRLEALCVLPCSLDLSRSGADHVCRINILPLSHLAWVPFTDMSMSHPNYLCLTGLLTTGYKERVGDLPALEVGCYDCHSRSCDF